MFTEETINSIFAELKIENPVFFIYFLPSFVWSKAYKKVVDYTSVPDLKNNLTVVSTDLIELKGTLADFLKSIEIETKDSFIFCINPDFLPVKNRKKYIRLKVLK